MVTIIFFAGCIFTLLFLSRKREIERRYLKKGLLYYFYQYSLEFLIPLILVVSFYFVLSLIILISSEYASLQFLIQLEESLEKIKSFFSIFKLNTISAFIILLVVLLLGVLFRLPAQSSKKLFRFFDKYQTLTRRLYIVLVLLCSFTLLGTQLGKPTADLQVRIKTIRDGYADIRQEIQEAVFEEVAFKLYEKTKDNLPSSYQEALKLPEIINGEINSLRDYYQSAQNEYAISIPAAQLVLDKNSTQVSNVSTLNTHIKIIEESPKRKTETVVSVPDQISYKKIQETKKSIEDRRNRLRSRIIDLLQIEGGKKVTLQIPKIFTYQLKTALVKSWITNYPILEPLIDVFNNTLDKEIESKVNRIIDSVTHSIIYTPKDIDNIISKESSTITEQKNILVSDKTLNQINQLNEQLEGELKDVQVAKIQIETQIEQSRSRDVELLFAYSPGCSHCEYQKPIIEEFDNAHPEIKVTWVRYYDLDSAQEKLIEGTSGHPVMVFHRRNDIRQVVGETSNSKLQEEFKTFLEQIESTRNSGDAQGSKTSGGSDIKCRY